MKKKRKIKEVLILEETTCSEKYCCASGISFLVFGNSSKYIIFYDDCALENKLGLFNPNMERWDDLSDKYGFLEITPDVRYNKYYISRKKECFFCGKELK